MNSVNLDNFADPFFLGETKEELRRIRQDFHVHPEIGLVTPRTSRIIADLLRKYGVDEVHEGIGGDGVVGVIYGKLPGDAAVGLRADIDALPLKELSDHDHVSQVEGAMHACGHDGHAAALLGAAKKLASERNFGGRVVLVFQPGEEGWSGAKHMMEDGLFERFPMQEIYAFHNSSAIEPGRIALNYGAMQAAADAFTIVVKGKGGHASRPNLNHDPVIAAAHIILALQTIVSREVDPLETAVVSCCSLQAGDPRAQSVCPDSCQIVGTARTFSPEVRDLVEKRIGEISASIAAGLGCTAVSIRPVSIRRNKQLLWPMSLPDLSVKKMWIETIREWPEAKISLSCWKGSRVPISGSDRAALRLTIRTLILMTRFFCWQPA